MKKVLILGALSAMAQETARCFAAEGASLFLVARDSKKLEMSAEDLRARGAQAVFTKAMDLTSADQHAGLIREAESLLEGIDGALIAYGSLPNSEEVRQNFNLVRSTFETNTLSAISLCMLLSDFFEKQHRGVLAVIGSVAGDRGRYKNFVYSASKSALATYLQGLRARVSASGVCVLTIKPGFVDTPMTAGLKKNFLFAPATLVGRVICSAMHSRRDHIYVPWFWRWIMLVVCLIPEKVFKRLKI